MTYIGPRGAYATIGLLTYGMRDTIASDIWSAVSDVARERGGNAFCFPGGTPHERTISSAMSEVAFDLAGRENVDGLVIWGGAIIGQKDVSSFYGKYHSLPLVSVALQVEGIPSLVADNYGAMRQTIRHLIEVHERRRIAFVCGPVGNAEAEERHRAYVDTLKERAIGLVPSLVIAPGVVTYDEEGGVEAVHRLLDERGLQPGVDFEAIVASNDFVALGALEALQRRGIRVPAEVAVTGFDDVGEASTVTPPLTTVRYSFYEMGQRAAEMLLDQMAGREVAEKVLLPLRLTVRESCGCLDPMVVRVAVESQLGLKSSESLADFLSGNRKDILSDMTMALGDSRGVFSEQVQGLLDSFVAEVEGGPSDSELVEGLFLGELVDALRGEAMGERAAGSGKDVAVWQDAVSVLRQHMLPYLTGEALSRAMNLWEQARVMIGSAAQRAEAQQALRAAERADLLREIGEALTTTSGVADLASVLMRELPRLGIPSAYLALYQDPAKPMAWSQLILGYDEANPVDSKRVNVGDDGHPFPSQRLAPEGILPDGRQYSYVVEPLHYLERQLGFVLLEVGPREGEVYDSLRSEISSAVQGALLTEQVARRAVQLQTAAEVSRSAGTVLEPDVLIQQVVDLVQKRFDLYYVGLFLVSSEPDGDRPDSRSAWAVLRMGSGEAGRKMMDQGHRLKVGGESMIGQCIADHQPRIALDVGEEAVRFDNPLLPETHSEMALPLVTREGAIGALSIQSKERGAFGEEEVAVFEAMAGQLANAIANARLYEMLQRENLRMEAELKVTQRLQQMLLPTEEELRRIEDLDIAGFMEPAEEVGGDYYDVLDHNGQIKIGIGDVTGHGLESGVVMLMLQTAVRTLLTSEEQDPVRFISILNRLLQENTQRMQVSKSMTLALLDYRMGQMQVSGQHEQVIVVRKGGQVELKDTLDLGFPLGLVSGVAEFVREMSIDLQPDDGIVLYSDGITEAQNEAKEFYGLERLCQVVSEHWQGTAEMVKGAVVADVKAFIGKQKVYDDITLVVIKQR